MNKSQFIQTVNILFPAALKWKAKMKKHHLREATANCPVCKGKNTIFMTLASSKDHIHLRCTNKECNVRLME